MSNNHITICNFLVTACVFICFSIWMNGPMSAVVPDVVEQEVDNYRRTSFKLEKTFSDVPAPKKIASKVSEIELYIFDSMLSLHSLKVTLTGFC